MRIGELIGWVIAMAMSAGIGLMMVIGIATTM